MNTKKSTVLLSLFLLAMCSSALVLFSQNNIGGGLANPTNILVVTPAVPAAPIAPEPDIFGFTMTDVTAFFTALTVVAMFVGRIISAIKAGTSVFKALFGGSAPAVKALQDQVKVIPAAIQTGNTQFLNKSIEDSKEEKKTL